MAWVTAYCLGPFGGNERTWKPFNPILGETFELDKEGGVRFLADQVHLLLMCQSILEARAPQAISQMSPSQA